MKLTSENLKSIFAVESQANIGCSYFINAIEKLDINKKIKEEMLASLIESTNISKENAFKCINDLSSYPLTGNKIDTFESILKSIIDSKVNMYTNVYPNAVRNAREEGLEDIARYFDSMIKIENRSANDFRRILINHMKNSKVTIFCIDRCNPCSNAKERLKSIGCIFTEINRSYDKTTQLELEMTANSRTFPKIFVNNTHIGGYTDLDKYTSL